MKQKRWHTLKEKKKKRIKSKALENLDAFEKEEAVTVAIEKAFDVRDKAKDDDKDSREILNPFPVFIFNAKKKDVEVKAKPSKSRVTGASKNRRKGMASTQSNSLVKYFTISRAATATKTGFKADDHI